MRGVLLTQSKVSLVDDEIFSIIRVRSWYYDGRGYARTNITVGKKQKQKSMHRFIWETARGNIPNGFVIDHINGDGLDNRLSNLRLVTQAQNNQNRREWKWGKSNSELAQMKDPEKLRRYGR